MYQAEKQVKELAEKAPAENKAKVEDKIKVCPFVLSSTSGHEDLFCASLYACLESCG